MLDEIAFSNENRKVVRVPSYKLRKKWILEKTREVSPLYLYKLTQMSNTVRLEQFIALVNDRLLKGQKLTELNAIWEEVSFFPTCKELVRNGTRKGEECGKACVHGQDKCLCHLPREASEKKNECEFVLKSGPNKGNACGKKCKEEMCPSHMRDITPCIATLKNGNPCGVTCKEGDLCKKHQDKEEDEKQEKQEVDDEEKPVKEKKEKKDKTEKAEKTEKKDKTEKKEKKEKADNTETEKADKADKTEKKEKKEKKDKTEKKEKKEKAGKKDKTEKKEEFEMLSDVPEDVSDTSSISGDDDDEVPGMAVEVEVAEVEVAAVAAVAAPAAVVDVAVVDVPVVAEASLCKNLLKNGANKGKECGRKCVEGKDTCSLHSK